MGTDIWGILNENQILNEPIFFHCVGNEGAFAYSKMASKSLADYVAGVVVESFDLGPEANVRYYFLKRKLIRYFRATAHCLGTTIFRCSINCSILSEASSLP